MIKRNVALVLGSGGARGQAHIGVIEELEKQGFKITSVCGSSIGSIIGGFYAMGKLPEYTEWICTLKKKDVYNLMDFTISSNGLLKAEKIIKKLNELIPDTIIENMKIPFSAVATDIINKKEVVFTKGSFYRAVRASVAIPTIITPVFDNSTILVDGGLLNPLPLNRVKRIKNDIVVAVNLYDSSIQETVLYNEYPEKNSETLSSFIDFLLNPKMILSLPPSKGIRKSNYTKSQNYYSLIQLSLSSMLERITQLTLQIYSPDIIINIPNSTARTFDFHRSSQLIEIGRNAAKISINEFLLDLYSECP